jgi:ribonuclease HII
MNTGTKGLSGILKPYFTKGLLEAGVDEAGRGCLAGPVVAAAVILPESVELQGLNDSKKLTEIQRALLEPLIKEQAIAWAIGVADEREIDSINILQATFLAMHRAIQGLNTFPALLLIDGNRFLPYPALHHKTIIGGDGLYASIAAASVLAKTHRDKLMNEIHTEYPEYSWKQNKGYGTILHRAAILEHGTTQYHRLTFKLLDSKFT